MKIRFSLIVYVLLICCYSGSEVAGKTPVNERKATSATVSSAKQNEINWRGKVAAGGIVDIFGVMGDIQAEASAGNEVEVIALNQGNQDELSQVDIRVEESEGGVRVCAAYPNVEGIGGPQCLESLEWSSNQWNEGDVRLRYKNGKRQSVRLIDVQVRFKVRIPMGVSFIARTLRGDITASFGTAEISSAIDLVTLGGNVSLEAPKAFNAHVSLKGGEIETDFPIIVVGRFPGSGVEGSIGQGGPKITLSAGGDVVLRRALLERSARQQPGTGTQRLSTPRSMPTVDQILDRYVQALGGVAALGKFTSRMMKMTLVIDYYIMDDMNLTNLSSLQAVDILLISAHGGVQYANTDSMKMGEERLGPEHLSHLSPSLVYLDSCNLGVSAHFIQSFRDRGTQFYLGPIIGNEAGNSSAKTIAYFFERLKAGDTPSKALFYTRKKLYEFYGEKEGFNQLLWRAFPFRVYLLN
jgi:hypothetical protein